MRFDFWENSKKEPHPAERKYLLTKSLSRLVYCLLDNGLFKTPWESAKIIFRFYVL